jgi:hypothetical protein
VHGGAGSIADEIVEERRLPGTQTFAP